MIPRISSVKPLENYKLLVAFDGGKTVVYDVEDDISTVSVFHQLKTDHGLFCKVQLDSSRTCVYWNEQIDLPSDTIWEYGVETDIASE